jgi:hypothetical protein
MPNPCIRTQRWRWVRHSASVEQSWAAPSRAHVGSHVAVGAEVPPPRQQMSPAGQLFASEQVKARPWQVVPFGMHEAEPPPPPKLTQQTFVAESHDVWPHVIGVPAPLDPEVLAPLDDPPDVPLLDDPPDVPLLDDPPDVPLLELAAPLDALPLALPDEPPSLEALPLDAPPSSSA